MNRQQPPVLPARLEAMKERRTRLVIVSAGTGEVPVWWRLNRSLIWHCAECGPMTRADCAHTFSAALVLADALLGLTPVAELNHQESA